MRAGSIQNKKWKAAVTSDQTKRIVRCHHIKDNALLLQCLDEESTTVLPDFADSRAAERSETNWST
jgi:hypothetical protein